LTRIGKRDGRGNAAIPLGQMAADQVSARQVIAADLKDALDVDSLCDDLAAVVHQALEPAHVSLWIRPDKG